MKDNPLISIITVTYNAELTIERTLQSVESQSYPRIEHLIIDGCSTDHTMSHVQRYVERNGENKHLIRVLREPDKGLYDAMNKGIQQATGYYLVFLNAGDKLHEPTSIEQIVEQTRWQRNQVNYAVIYGETDLVDNKGHFLRHRRLQAPEHLTAKSFRQGMLVCHQSFYVRTDIARAELYDLRYRYSADYDWCIRIMRESSRRKLPLRNVHAVLTHFLDGGMTTQNHKASLKERFQVMRTHYGLLPTLAVHAWFVIRGAVKK